ncbi:MAG: polysaccharide deacetylase family protein [Alphaproteobacteria bacterium]
MLNPDARSVVDIPASSAPRLVVVVDTEEEFDWSRPLSRANTAVGATRHQARAHRVYERYGVRPVYVVDYPIATQEAGYRPLREFCEDGLCEIGAHLHPWVNPPFDEEVSAHNSYPGNLPRGLEREKLRRLTAAIEENFGVRPVTYKAGRYGVGPATGDILAELGYEIDTSVVPAADMRRDFGPDFRRCGAKPYRFGPGGRLLEIPLSAGFFGCLSRAGPALYPALTGAPGARLRLPGVFARLALLEWSKLTPEGIDHAEHRRLTEALFATGHRVFCLAYHSPSLEPGNTPYVRSDDDLAVFLARIERYLDYFFNELGGRPATAREIRGMVGAS